MPFAMPEMVQETTQTTGTGTYALDGAITNYRSFADEFGATPTSTVYIVFDTQPTPSYEIGIGLWTPGTPDTLTRQVIKSTNSDLAVSWGASKKNVVAGLPGVLLGTLFDPTGTAGVVKMTSGLPSTVPITTAGENIINMASYAALKAALDLEVGTDFNAYSGKIAAIAALAGTSGYFLVGTGSSWTHRALVVGDIPQGSGSTLDADTLDGTQLSALMLNAGIATHEFTDLSSAAYGSWAHGVSQPTILNYYIEKTAAGTIGGWNQNDRIYGYTGTATNTFIVGADSTYIYWALGSGNLEFVNKTGSGTTGGISAAGWKLVVKVLV